MKIVLFLVAIAVWIFVLRVLTRAKLPAWRFIWGAVGLFVILMIFVLGYITQPLAQGVTAITGVIGQLTGTFDAFFKYGIIYVPASDGSITLQIDMECSGAIEILAFVCLLAFFRVYSPSERVVVGLTGVVGIMFANALRVLIICEIVHFCGVGSYAVAHTYIGRLVFYGLTVLLYFYVFTRRQVKDMKVGEFEYGDRA